LVDRAVVDLTAHHAGDHIASSIYVCVVCVCVCGMVWCVIVSYNSSGVRGLLSGVALVVEPVERTRRPQRRMSAPRRRRWASSWPRACTCKH
jgi:hypothetical protein